MKNCSREFWMILFKLPMRPSSKPAAGDLLRRTLRDMMMEVRVKSRQPKYKPMFRK